MLGTTDSSKSSKFPGMCAVCLCFRKAFRLWPWCLVKLVRCLVFVSWCLVQPVLRFLSHRRGLVPSAAVKKRAEVLKGLIKPSEKAPKILQLQLYLWSHFSFYLPFVWDSHWATHFFANTICQLQGMEVRLTAYHSEASGGQRAS